MSLPVILLVDDEPHIADVLDYLLRDQGFRTITAPDAASALRTLTPTASGPDLVILDLGLPDMPGLDLLRHLRTAHPALPVIVLTARAEELDRVLGLELGADDYVTKPFSAREVVARVRAVLRRTATPASASPGTALIHGLLRIEPDALTATFDGHPLVLTRAEFRLLECLARHPARTFTRDALIDRLYDGAHVVTDRSVDACVKRLRRKFSKLTHAPDPIQTMHGLGYKLGPALEAPP